MSEGQAASIIPPSLVPSGVSDLRQQALAGAFGKALGAIDLTKLAMTDPMVVDARLLPFMILEFGAQEFIDPDLPEHVQRRVLANIWKLKSLHGYDAGVKLGLKLLGISMQIEHWWQVEPKREPNTHKLFFFVGEALFPDELSVLNERSTRAAIRMINATKRWSQEGELIVGARLTLPRLRTAVRSTRLSLCKHRCTLGQFAPRVRTALKSSVSEGGQVSATAVRLKMAQQTPRLSVTRKTALAAVSSGAATYRITLKGDA